MGLTLEERVARTFRAYDVRGVYEDDLDRKVARHVGYGVSRYLRHDRADGEARLGPIAVCRDVRHSSEPLAKSLIKGLNRGGVDVLDLGEGPTPLLYYACKQPGVVGGVMVTGSHNPPEQNGFKVWLGGGNVFGEDLARIGELGLLGRPKDVETEGVVEERDLSGEYAAEVFASAREGLTSERPLKIAVDCGNGTAGPYIVKLLRELGCSPMAICADPDGNFPNHHPDPTVPAYLEDLAGLVVASGCELGIAFDGDSDRLGALDGKGQIVYADRLLYLFGREVAQVKPGSKVIGDVKCSDVVFEGLAEAGAEVIMSRTGHSFIKQRMKDEDAALAGEMSGHFFFADRYLGYDDAIYAACRLAVLLMNSGESLAEALSALRATASTPELRLACAEDEKEPALAALGKILEEELRDAGGSGRTPISLRRVDRTDGLRLSFDDGWCLVRASNTEAILVLRFEGLDEKALKRIEEFFSSRFKEAVPELYEPLLELLGVPA